MKYVPYGPDLEQTPNIVVDGWGNDATVLVLSHWPRSGTPSELKADTSAEIVINYLRSPQREAYRGGAGAVSNNHFDIDGLIGLWAMLNPERAFERAELLVAAGECGDFQRWSGEQATKIACALHGLETNPSSPLRQGLADGAGFLKRTASLYERALPLVPRLLDEIDSFEEYWRDEYERVLAGREIFARGEAHVVEAPEIDLAVFYLRHEVHDMALYERTTCSRVALVIDDDRYQFRYRYESWVELQSRQPPPRIDMRPLAEFLQSFEGSPGEWTADGVETITPRLRLRGPEGDSSPSSITAGLFVRLLAQHLRDNAANRDLLWSPATADFASG